MSTPPTGRRARVFGSETEYGIVAPTEPDASPIITSTQAVIAYAEHCGLGARRRTRWDYDDESPLRDIRGFDLRRYRHGAAPVLDPNAVGAANVVTTSGARFYVDHAHPEYSSPETTSAWQAMIYDEAGDVLMHRAAVASGQVPDQPELKIYKNNVDGKGASYGAHENYLHRRDLDPEALHPALIAHFVTRQIMCGAGRVGLGVTGAEPGFQISQRADYIETDISLETTLNRGIINTRDEPHATADTWRRLHVIIGDATMSQYATYLKFGTTSLVLDAVAAGADFSDLVPVEPVAALRQISRDVSCSQPIRLYGRRSMTAIEIQSEIRRRVLNALDDPPHASTPSGPTLGPLADPLTDDERRVLALWEETLADLARDPLLTADRLDWTAKLALLRGYRARGVEWSDPRMALVDLQYHDIDPERGLHYALRRRGRMRQFVDASAVLAAVDQPPRDTRAWVRGGVIASWPQQVLAANWDSLILDVPYGQHPATRLRLSEPLAFTAEELAGPAAEATDDPTAAGPVPEAGGRPRGELQDLLARIQRSYPDALTGVGSV